MTKAPRHLDSLFIILLTISLFTSHIFADSNKFERRFSNVSEVVSKEERSCLQDLRFFNKKSVAIQVGGSVLFGAIALGLIGTGIGTPIVAVITAPVMALSTISSIGWGVNYSGLKDKRQFKKLGKTIESAYIHLGHIETKSPKKA